MMCNEILLDFVIAESESAALDATVCLSSLVPGMPSAVLALSCPSDDPSGEI